MTQPHDTDSFADFDAFAAAARAAGFDEVLERTWAPHLVLDTHTHPFAVRARVVRGEMWLIHAGAERHLVAGDDFELPARAPHAERYGPEGAAFWVARRHVPVT
jgi:hypothetical protein